VPLFLEGVAAARKSEGGVASVWGSTKRRRGQVPRGSSHDRRAHRGRCGCGLDRVGSLEHALHEGAQPYLQELLEHEVTGAGAVESQRRPCRATCRTACGLGSPSTVLAGVQLVRCRSLAEPDGRCRPARRVESVGATWNIDRRMRRLYDRVRSGASSIRHDWLARKL